MHVYLIIDSIFISNTMFILRLNKEHKQTISLFGIHATAKGHIYCRTPIVMAIRFSQGHERKSKCVGTLDQNHGLPEDPRAQQIPTMGSPRTHGHTRFQPWTHPRGAMGTQESNHGITEDPWAHQIPAMDSPKGGHGHTRFESWVHQRTHSVHTSHNNMDTTN